MKTKRIDFNCPKGGRRITNLVRKAKADGYEAIQFLDTLISLKAPDSKKGTKSPEPEIKAPVHNLYAIKIKDKKDKFVGYFNGFKKPLEKSPIPHTEWYIHTAMNEIAGYFQDRLRYSVSLSSIIH